MTAGLIAHNRPPAASPRDIHRRALSAWSATIDHGVVDVLPAPASCTGDDVVELSVHGSPVVLDHDRGCSRRSSARVSPSPGEFTLRAYLNGRIDLTQAEAVADLIDAVTPLQARAAFDQLHGTLTRSIGEIDARAVRSDRASRSVG